MNEVINMFQVKQKNLSQVCPQCCKLIDSSAYRLVHDTCGHLKCRICLLQEITGCLSCNTEENSSICSAINSKSNQKVVRDYERQPRKSVITSLAIQIAEKTKPENFKFILPSPETVDNDTCNLIQQTLQKDILFPTEIVKKSTGNFYHLKRIFSQRFFSEDNNNKKHKACGTEDKMCISDYSINHYHKGVDQIRQEWCGELPSHIRVQYYCTIHKMTLEEKNSLKQHMACNCKKNEAQNSLYRCTLCLKEYKVRSKLNRHMKVHTKNTKFKCSQCEKPCLDNYALKTHERSHTGNKPYSCAYCEKKFSGLHNFKRHEKKHLNEKKFICNECGFKFFTNAELKRHSVIHTSAKLFACDICCNKFSFRRTLTRHLKSHNVNISKLKCSYCESTFQRKDNLERHIKSSHCDIKP